MTRIPIWRVILIVGSVVLGISIIVMLYGMSNLIGALGSVGPELDAQAARTCSIDEQVVKLPSPDGPSTSGSLGFDYYCEDAQGQRRDITRETVRSFSQRISQYPLMMIVATVTIVAGILTVIFAFWKRKASPA